MNLLICGKNIPLRFLTGGILRYTVWTEEVNSLLGASPKEGVTVTDKVKTSVNLSEDAVQALKDIASSRGTNMSEVLRHAISLEKFVHEETKDGAKILVEKDNDVRQLVINP